MIENIKLIIEQPRESLSVEIKGWLNLNTVEHKAKIIKTLIALRNLNGGYIIFGFNDKTYEQEPDQPEGYATLFHPDKIQGWVTKYSSDPFEVNYAFPEKNNIKHPVLIVPSGVKSVVAAKADLQGPDGKNLISAHDVYIRSVLSNNTPSTTKPTWKDWPNVIETYFDNREADIGNFLRRHLGTTARENIISDIGSTEKTNLQIAQEFHTESLNRFNEIIKEKKLPLQKQDYWACSLIINGKVPEHRANKDFLRMLDANNPRYTGWPVWHNTEGARDSSSHPRVYHHIWETTIVDSNYHSNGDIDFYRINPKGQFFIRRTLEDDLARSNRSPKPFTELDFGIAILRTAETIAVGLAFAKSMGCIPEETTLFYQFEWNNLNGRELSSWASPMNHIYDGKKAYQDKVMSSTEISLDTPLSRVSEYVKKVIDPLFEVFDGFEINQKVVDDLTTKLLNRTL